MTLTEYFQDASDPKTFAFLSIDVQRMFCDKLDLPDWLERYRDYLSMLSVRQRTIDSIVDNIIAAQNSLREAGAQIIHVNAAIRPEALAQYYKVRSQPQDIEETKQLMSAFNDDEHGHPEFSSNLEEILQERGIRNLIVGGFHRNACVKHTVISALKRNFKVAVLSDCTLHHSDAVISPSNDDIDEMRRKGAFISNRQQAVGFIQSLAA